MSDIACRIIGKTGHITLQRPDALNALTHAMTLQIEQSLEDWRDKVTLVIIDAQGDKAFCAGGDIASLYESAQRGDIAYGRRFWRDEYRLNVKLAEYAVPIVSFLQGFVMGGGVGLGCHVSHRIVCETSRVAMPECAIGLLPDVGGSLFLANTPGNLGKYLGLTGARMQAADAIYTGFADIYAPYAVWPDLKARLLETGDISIIDAFTAPAPDGSFATDQATLDVLFAPRSLEDITIRLKASPSALAAKALRGLSRGAPLAQTCCLAALDHMRGSQSLRDALALEYRFTARAVDQGDFPEGIRALIIDKDNAPNWAHQSPADVTVAEVSAMLADLGADELDLEDTA